MVIFSLLYGIFYVNFIDIITPGSSIPGYHLWLMILYFIPFLSLLIIYGLRMWKIIVFLAFIVSLMNDLLFYPVKLLFFQKSPNLYEWYLFQLGFKGTTTAWTFNAAFLTIPVTSILMGLTIYLRVAIIMLLFISGKRFSEKMWRTGQSKN